ncbi:MAG: hypothetical protein AAF551_13365 [Bacteroidota bacterium]
MKVDVGKSEKKVENEDTGTSPPLVSDASEDELTPSGLPEIDFKKFLGCGG